MRTLWVEGDRAYALAGFFQIDEPRRLHADLFDEAERLHAWVGITFEDETMRDRKRPIDLLRHIVATARFDAPPRSATPATATTRAADSGDPSR